jgi:PsbP
VLGADEDSADIARSTARLSFGSSKTPMEGRASGLTAGDYRKAEGLSFYVSGGMPPGKTKVDQLPVGAILDLCTPGDATGQAAEYKVTKDTFDAETGYRTVLAKYESTTVSGYTVERRLITAATMLSDGKLYALAGSCSENRLKKIGDTLARAVGTFRVYRL